MSELKKYRELQKETKDFYLNNKEKIDKELTSEKAVYIRDFLNKQLALENMVWCRNGGVTPEATDCKLILCKYKSNADFIVEGCMKCQTFQVTYPAGNWASAIHIDME